MNGVRPGCAAAMCVALLVAASPNGRAGGEQVALLVGVRQYRPDELRNLPYAEADVEGLARTLQTIGYLPENPPLYLDMTVAGYLDFVARIKNVPPGDRTRRIDAALEMANITDKRDDLIKRLSRGYKQRVGLAQALVHDPDVIILDEPTVGLDPKQIVGIRQLINSDDPQSYFGLRGGGIGWGLPATIGVKLALPDRPVIGLIGDGSAM